MCVGQLSEWEGGGVASPISCNADDWGTLWEGDHGVAKGENNEVGRSSASACDETASLTEAAETKDRRETITSRGG